MTSWTATLRAVAYVLTFVCAGLAVALGTAVCAPWSGTAPLIWSGLLAGGLLAGAIPRGHAWAPPNLSAPLKTVLSGGLSDVPVSLPGGRDAKAMARVRLRQTWHRPALGLATTLRGLRVGRAWAVVLFGGIATALLLALLDPSAVPAVSAGLGVAACSERVEPESGANLAVGLLILAPSVACIALVGYGLGRTAARSVGGDRPASPTPGWLLLVLGTAAWLCAQLLPAWTFTPLDQITHGGLTFTFMPLAYAFGPSGYWVAWSGNLILLVAWRMAGRRSQYGRAALLTAAATVCAVAGVLTVMLGNRTWDEHLEVGTLVWFGSFAILTLGFVVRGLEFHPHARRLPLLGLALVPAVLVVAAAGLIEGPNSEMAPQSSAPAFQPSFPEGPCDLFCDAIVDTPVGTVAVGRGWDEGASLSEGYLAAWVVRDGTMTRSVLTREDDDIGLSYIIPWGEERPLSALASKWEPICGSGSPVTARSGRPQRGLPFPARVPSRGR